MNYQHLKYFITLADEKNYQKAACKCYISQPALTKAIQNLEEYFDVKLFEKEGRNNVLTKQGLFFYNEAKKSIAILESSITKMKTGNIHNELINVGAIYECATTCVPLSFSLFNKNHNNSNFTLHQLTSEQIILKLKERKLDMGIVSSIPEGFNDDSFDTMLLFYHPVVVAMPDSHPLANCDKLKYVDIMDIDFVYYTEYCGKFHTLESKMKSLNLEMPHNIKIRCDAEDSIISYVKNGFGIGLVSDTIYNRKLGLNLKTLEDVDFKFPVYIIWNKEKLTNEVYNNYIKYILQSHQKSTF